MSHLSFLLERWVACHSHSQCMRTRLLGARVHNPGLEPSNGLGVSQQFVMKSNKDRDCRDLFGRFAPCPYLLG